MRTLNKKNITIMIIIVVAFSIQLLLIQSIMQNSYLKDIKKNNDKAHLSNSEIQNESNISASSDYIKLTEATSSNTLKDLKSELDNLSTDLNTLQSSSDIQNTKLKSIDSQLNALVTTNNNQNTSISNLQNDNTFVKNFLKAHPVGSIYITTSSTDPSNTYSGSTWVAYAGGRTLVGVGSNAGYSFSAGQTGGEYTHRLSTSEIASHSHNYIGLYMDCNYKTGYIVAQGDLNLVYYLNTSVNPYSAGWATQTFTNSYSSMSDTCVWAVGVQSDYSNTSYTGSSTYHNNVQPYVTVYMWRRTA